MALANVIGEGLDGGLQYVTNLNNAAVLRLQSKQKARAYFEKILDLGLSVIRPVTNRIFPV